MHGYVILIYFKIKKKIQVMVLPNLGSICMIVLITDIIPQQMADPLISSIVFIAWKPLDVGQYAGQPFALLFLSKEFRLEVFKDFRKFVLHIPIIQHILPKQTGSVNQTTQVYPAMRINQIISIATNSRTVASERMP